MKAITCPVILESCRTCKDGSLSITFSTPELLPADKLAFFEILQVQSRMLLQPESESSEGLRDIKKEFDVKTPSQRLRAVLFVAWKQANKPMEFNDYYSRRIEHFINEVKQNLLPE